MSDQPIKIPDFTAFGYRVEQLLGGESSSSNSGLMWRATKTKNGERVVIRELRFGNEDSSWQAYDRQQQELELLQRLEHTKVPKYLEIFETDSGFCLVREYIVGESLTMRSPSTEAEIIAIAVGVLQILRYLQQQEPPVLHLNLNPDNILRDEKDNVYLIGFQLAQTADKQSSSSAIALDNAEFIPPEQLKQPTTASDIYGLGATLQKIILLEPKLDFADLDEGLQDWLNKASNPDLKVRYQDTETALAALQASSWEDLAIAPTVTTENKLSNRAYALGVASLGILGIAITVGYQVSLRSEKSSIQMIIAIMAMVIIYLTQSAAATIVTSDRNEQKQAVIFAVGIPLSLVVITGFIWGKGEAVEVSLGTAIAQAATLFTVLYSRLAQSSSSATVKLMGIAIVMVSGLVCGRLIF